MWRMLQDFSNLCIVWRGRRKNGQLVDGSSGRVRTQTGPSGLEEDHGFRALVETEQINSGVVDGDSVRKRHDITERLCIVFYKEAKEMRGAVATMSFGIVNNLMDETLLLVKRCARTKSREKQTRDDEE
jgi:hypothetical protein